MFPHLTVTRPEGSIMSTQDWTDGNDGVQYRSRKSPDDAPQHLRHNRFVKRKRPTGFNGIHRRRNKRFTW